MKLGTGIAFGLKVMVLLLADLVIQLSVWSAMERMFAFTGQVMANIIGLLIALGVGVYMTYRHSARTAWLYPTKETNE
jgi:hypothetical protein